MPAVILNNLRTPARAAPKALFPSMKFGPSNLKLNPVQRTGLLDVRLHLTPQCKDVRLVNLAVLLLILRISAHSCLSRLRITPIQRKDTLLLT